MTRTRRSLLRAGCGVLAGGVLAGCVGDSPSAGSDTETGSVSTEPGPKTETTGETTIKRPTTSPTAGSPTTAPEGTETRGAATGTMTRGATSTNQGCNGATSLAFYGLTEGFGWDRRHILVGFGLDANAYVRLVAYEGDSVLGTAESHAPDHTGVAVDGQPISLDKPLTGEHTIRVVMYPAPKNGGEFDAENAMPCRHGGEVIQAGPETIDFSAFTPSTTTM